MHLIDSITSTINFLMIVSVQVIIIINKYRLLYSSYFYPLVNYNISGVRIGTFLHNILFIELLCYNISVI